MSQNLFDPAPIAELRILDQDNSANLVNSLIDMFFAAAEPSAKDMLEAARGNNAEKLGQIAHTLRATSGNLGAEACSLLCGEIEEMALYHSQKVSTLGVSLCRKLIEIIPETIEILRQQRL